MTRYVELETADGSTILVEAEGEFYEPFEMAKGVDLDGQLERAKTSFEDGLEVIRRTADTFIGKIRSLVDPPDEVEVTFGLKMSGELGSFVVAKAGAEANYEVKMTWKREGQRD